jgi:preprotein translocase subunit SecE
LQERLLMAKTNPAQFVRQVRQEINRITWATKRETMFASLTVFVMVLIASAFFFLVDLLLSNVVQILLGFGG